jgi:catechol 2,3-dioxygenase-like lactoylglutathione lyase family enzyme
MAQTLANVTFLVREYDEAITFFTEKLGFQLVEDSPQPDGKRWVLVRPNGPLSTTCLLLAQATTPAQSMNIGKQAGDHVCFFLHTDDFWRDYNAMRSRDVIFQEQPREEPYGTVAVFADLYGNRWDLLMPSNF